jgi:hypothetical protein
MACPVSGDGRDGKLNTRSMVRAKVALSSRSPALDRVGSSFRSRLPENMPARPARSSAGPVGLGAIEQGAELGEERHAHRVGLAVVEGDARDLPSISYRMRSMCAPSSARRPRQTGALATGRSPRGWSGTMMLTNSVLPSGENVAPANLCLVERVAREAARRRRESTRRRNCSPDHSSHTTSTPA